MDKLVEWLRQVIDDAWDEAERERNQATIDLCEAHSLLLDEYDKAKKTSVCGYLQALERSVQCVGQAYRHLPGYDEGWMAGPSPLLEEGPPC